MSYKLLQQRKKAANLLISQGNAQRKLDAQFSSEEHRTIYMLANLSEVLSATKKSSVESTLSSFISGNSSEIVTSGLQGRGGPEALRDHLQTHGVESSPGTDKDADKLVIEPQSFKAFLENAKLPELLEKYRRFKDPATSKLNLAQVKHISVNSKFGILEQWNITPEDIERGIQAAALTPSKANPLEAVNPPAATPHRNEPEPAPALPEIIAERPQRKPDMPARDSFCYKILFHRAQRAMTETDLARRVKEITTRASEESAVTKETIRAWERAKEVPGQAHYEALERVLITENSSIGEKKETRAAFRAAYETALKAQHAPHASEADRFAFSEALDQLQERTDMYNPAQLAEKVSASAKAHAVPQEAGSINALLMVEIQAGFHHPSRTLAKAIIHALDEEHPLSDKEKEALWSAYDQASKQAGPTYFTDRIKAESQDNLSLADVKQQMADIFKGAGFSDNLSIIAQGETLGHSLHQTDLSNFLGKTAYQRPMSKEKINTYREGFNACLDAKNVPSDVKAAFNILFEQFENLTVQSTRKTARG